MRASDVDMDPSAVMNNRKLLLDLYGNPWGRPTATMTAEQDLDDVQNRRDETDRPKSFNYAILAADTEVFGCIYIDPITTEDDQQVGPATCRTPAGWRCCSAGPSWWALNRSAAGSRSPQPLRSCRRGPTAPPGCGRRCWGR
jgi:hypothetical protein